MVWFRTTGEQLTAVMLLMKSESGTKAGCWMKMMNNASCFSPSSGLLLHTICQSWLVPSSLSVMHRLWFMQCWSCYSDNINGKVCIWYFVVETITYLRWTTRDKSSYFSISCFNAWKPFRSGLCNRMDTLRNILLVCCHWVIAISCLPRTVRSPSMRKVRTRGGSERDMRKSRLFVPFQVYIMP